MLKEALAELKTQTLRASDPRLVPVDLGPRQKAVVIDGLVKTFDQPDPPYDYRVDTQDDFCMLAEKFIVELILVGEPNVIGFVSADKQLDKITWERHHTPAFLRLQEWAAGKACTQQELIALLRNELREAEGATTMLASVRNLRFHKSSDTAATVNRGEESLGKEMLAKMSNADQLPEFLKICTPIYTDQGDDSAIEFTLLFDPLPSQEKIKLQALQDELDHALLGTRQGTKDSLAEDLQDVTVVLGRA